MPSETPTRHGTRSPLGWLLLWPILGVVLLLLGGCAGSRKPQPSPALEEVPRAGGVELPGMKRRLPSDQNAAPANAPEAFPALAPAQRNAGPGGEPGGGGRARDDAANDPDPRDQAETTNSSAPASANPASAPSPSSEPPAAAPRGPVDYSVQLAATATEWGAKDRVRAWSPLFQEPLRIDEGEGLFKVRLGRFSDEDAAHEALRVAVAAGLNEAFIVEVPR